mmetsp:Transcript_95151/g.268863  ORF Transcript_95151/g.268863 Transcript_95151/m.268863 type:complete len:195 (-) Transcript_95151:109-693(-)
MKEWIMKVAANRGSKGGSAKCPVGAFKSKIKDAVVPLCEEHFPDDKAKNEWLVLFYNQKDIGDLKGIANQFAVDMGNDPPDMNKALKKQKKRRDRITEVAGKHGVKVNLPAKGPFGMDALLKIGGVCCDCGDDSVAFCASSLRFGEVDIAPPQAFWVAKGQRALLNGTAFTAQALTENVFMKLGFAAHAAKAEL